MKKYNFILAIFFSLLSLSALAKDSTYVINYNMTPDTLVVDTLDHILVKKIDSNSQSDSIIIQSGSLNRKSFVADKDVTFFRVADSIKIQRDNHVDVKLKHDNRFLNVRYLKRGGSSTLFKIDFDKDIQGEDSNGNSDKGERFEDVVARHLLRPISDAIKLKTLKPTSDGWKVIYASYYGESQVSHDKYIPEEIVESLADEGHIEKKSSKITTASASTPSLSSTLGGLNVTRFADGLARFIVNRAKQELNIAFFEKMKEHLNEYPDLRTLFPKTVSTLDNMGEEIYLYKRFISTLREEFQNDIHALPDNLPGIVDNHPDFFNKMEGLEDLFVETMGVVADIRDEVHPGAALNAMDALSFQPLDTNLTACFRTVQWLSESLRDTSTSKGGIYWAPKKLINEVLNDRETFKIYLGLIRQQAVQWDSIRGESQPITFRGGYQLVDMMDSLISTINRAENAGTELRNIKRVIRSLANNTHRVKTKIDQFSDEDNGAAEENMALYEIRSYFQHLIEIANSTKSLIELLPKKDRPDLVQFERGISMIDELSQLTAHITKKKYGAALANVLNVYDLLSAREKNMTADRYVAEYHSYNSFNTSLNRVHEEIYSKSQGTEGGVREGYNNRKKFDKILAEKPDDVEAMLKSIYIYPENEGIKADLDTIVQFVQSQEYFKNGNKTKQQLLKYGTFIANMANAESSEEVAEVIDQFAMPVGSWRVKRNTRWNFALNAYLGIDYSVFDQKTVEEGGEEPNRRFGITAPVGLTVSHTFNGGQNLGLHVSLLDVGAIASFRFKNDSSDIADIFLKEIIAPGGYLTWAPFPKVPLVLNAGYQWTPLLKSVKTEDNVTRLDRRGRLHFAIAVDIPIFNISSSGTIDKKVEEGLKPYLDGRLFEIDNEEREKRRYRNQPQLTFVNAVPIDTTGLFNLAPSGLTMYDDTLYIVSDNHTDIFAWSISSLDDNSGSDPLRYEKRVTVSTGIEDFEGITAVARDSFIMCTEDTDGYVLSVKVDDATGTAKAIWNTPRFKAANDGNAYFEGIVYDPDSNQLILAQERDSLKIWIKNGGTETAYEVSLNFENNVEEKDDAQDDLSALYLYNGRLYGISRKYRSLVRLEKEGNGYKVDRSWSYASTVYYKSIDGGIEGLVITDDYIIMVDDNMRGHNKGRESYTFKDKEGNKRPHIYLFNNPGNLLE